MSRDSLAKPGGLEVIDPVVPLSPFRKFRGTRSVREVAIALDVTDQTVRNWERVVYLPDLLLADQFAAVYGVSLQQVERAIVESARLIRSRLASEVG